MKINIEETYLVFILIPNRKLNKYNIVINEKGNTLMFSNWLMEIIFHLNNSLKTSNLIMIHSVLMGSFDF